MLKTKEQKLWALDIGLIIILRVLLKVLLNLYENNNEWYIYIIFVLFLFSFILKSSLFFIFFKIFQPNFLNCYRVVNVFFLPFDWIQFSAIIFSIDKIFLEFSIAFLIYFLYLLINLSIGVLSIFKYEAYMFL